MTLSKETRDYLQSVSDHMKAAGGIEIPPEDLILIGRTLPFVHKYFEYPWHLLNVPEKKERMGAASVHRE